MKRGVKLFNCLLVFAALVSAVPVSAATIQEDVADENAGLLEQSNPGDAFSFESDERADALVAHNLKQLVTKKDPDGHFCRPDDSFFH